MSSPIDEKTPKGSVEGDPLPLNLIKSLGPKTGSETGENGSSNGGNNSDNSALVSIGNTSFGFNFDSEDLPLRIDAPRYTPRLSLIRFSAAPFRFGEGD